MKTRTAVLAMALLSVPAPVPAGAQVTVGQSGDQATVWYLRHSGWAVRLGGALLVFDYQESMGLEEVSDATPRNLENGFLNPEELRGLDVYVFVSHAHGDHFDPVIFGWQGRIEHLTYFIGWDEEPRSHCERFAGRSAACYTLGGPRAKAVLDRIHVYTINSAHNGIPEVAYLVRYRDWVVYHNGDYMADYVADHAYLKTITDRIDLAFVQGAPTHRWPHLARAVHMTREFRVPVLFPMHFRDQEMCRSFVADVAAEGVSAQVTCPTARGQRFVVAKGGLASIRF